MGNVPSTSKSRRQHPQYNPDNESSAQLGAASSEHLRSLPLAKWDTGTSDEIPLSSWPAAAAAHKKKTGSNKKKKRGSSSTFPGAKTSRQTTTTGEGRASIEAVCGSPDLVGKMGSDNGKTEMQSRNEGVGGETWGTANGPYCEGELAGIGGWIVDVGKKGVK